MNQPLPPLDLGRRCRLPELMDDPQLDRRKHAAALTGLQRINWISRTSSVVWNAIRTSVAQESRPLRILDLACGGGEVAVGVARRALKCGWDVAIDGCDISPTAVAQAQLLAQRASCPQANFVTFDVLGSELPQGYDVIMCSLFLHHLSNADAESLLRRMAAATRRLVVVNDLHRCRFGYYLARLGSRFLTLSPIVHYDGPVSVRSAFTSSELLQMAEAAGMNGGAVRRVWPARFLFTWSRSP